MFHLQSWALSALLAFSAGCVRFHPQPLSPEKTAAAFTSRSLADDGLRAFLETNNVPAPAAGDAWNLKQLTLVAFYYQPSLAEARAQLLAAQAAKITAGERPNPSLSVTPGYDSGIPDNPSPWLVSATLNWPIETAGKRGYRLAQAEHQAEAARWNLVGAVWQVRSTARAALLNLYATHETEALLAREESAQSNVVRLLEGQFSVGSVSSYDVTQARVALDNTRLALQQAAGQYQQARAQLAMALGIPLRALDDTPFSFADFQQFPSQLAQPQVQRQALLSRADVRAALASYAAAQSALQLEIANQYPDLNLGPGYAWNAGSAGDNQWTLGATLTLPILNQNRGPVAEAEANRKLAAAHFITVQSQAIGQIDMALAAYHAALLQVATAGVLQENLRKQLDSVRQQAQAGELDPLTVANAEVAFDAGAQGRLNALIQAQMALGALEDAVQSPLTLPARTLGAAEEQELK